MKIGFYPGSFSPWHEGHLDVLNKALKIFDKIVILQLTNTDKGEPKHLGHHDLLSHWSNEKVEIVTRENVSIIEALGTCILGMEVKGNEFAVIRGLRNEQDFCAEQIQQYWYEDLGVLMPIFYVISDRTLVHVSSSAIRAVNKFTEK